MGIENEPLPQEVQQNAPKIFRIMNFRMSIHAIYFVKTRRVIATAGYVKEKDKWLAAILHYESHKIVCNTKPAFKSKAEALEFCNELIEAARNTKIS